MNESVNNEIKNNPATNGEVNVHSMRWYNFLIYFLLYFLAVANFLFGLFYIYGTIHLVQSNLEPNAVYKLYGGLQNLDMIFGFLSIGLGAFVIHTRNILASYTRNSPKILYIMYGVSGLFGIVYNVFYSIITGLSIPWIYFAAVIVAEGIVILLNYLYFSKREYLFNS